MTFRPKPHKAWLASLLLSAGALLGGVVPEAEAEDPLKVGFVYVGPVGDYGWSYEHNRGRLEAEKACLLYTSDAADE